MRENLIPLAGRGQRFRDEGYKDPKSLIEVNGAPMVVAAAESLPTADRYTFLALQEHIDSYAVDKAILAHVDNAEVIPVKGVTEGQASTCLLAENAIQPDSQLTIGACDNGMLYNPKKFDALIGASDTDAIIWTFRHNPNVLLSPKHWGWVKVGKKGLVEKISVKIPVSKDPINDHAVIGCFSFRKASFFFENAKKMIKANRRINNEFYIDECMNVIIENGLKIKVFEVDKYIGWGTPNDLKTYQYWQGYFNLKHAKA